MLICWVVFLGFYLGHSQVSSPLAGFIPLVGDYGTSFLVLLTSLLLVHALKKPFVACSLIVLIWGAGWQLNQIHWTDPEATPLRVSLVQANTPQSVKWDPTQFQSIVDHYTSHIPWESDLIVWPEAAIPTTRYRFHTELDQLQTKTHAHNTGLILGIIDGIPNHYYNALIGLGNASGTYHKRHLVMFGEYLPFEWLRGIIGFFTLPMSNFKPGPIKQPLLMINGKPIASFICYDIAYTDLLIDALPQAKLLLAASNDAWFDRSFARAQHRQIAQVRALQSGRYLLFSTNNGLTAIINPKGKIQKALTPDISGILTDIIYPMTGETPFIRLTSKA